MIKGKVEPVICTMWGYVGLLSKNSGIKPFTLRRTRAEKLGPWVHHPHRSKWWCTWAKGRETGRRASQQRRAVHSGEPLRGARFHLQMEEQSFGLGLVQRTALVLPLPWIVQREWESMLSTSTYGLILITKKCMSDVDSENIGTDCSPWKGSSRGHMERTETKWGTRMIWGSNLHAINIISLIQQIFIRWLLCDSLHSFREPGMWC